MNPRHTFARNKAPTRSYWRAKLTDILLWMPEEKLTREHMPRWVEKLAPGEVEQAIALEKERRAAREDAA